MVTSRFYHPYLLHENNQPGNFPEFQLDLQVDEYPYYNPHLIKMTSPNRVQNVILTLNITAYNNETFRCMDELCVIKSASTLQSNMRGL